MAALLFIDSFDHYSVGQGPRKWTTWSAVIVTGRTGNGAQVGTGQTASKTLGAQQLTLAMGVAYNTAALSNAIITLGNGPSSFNASLVHLGDGRLRALFNAGLQGGTGAASTFVMNTNIWYYVEFQCTVTVGTLNTGTNTYPLDFSYTARVNEAVILTGTVHVDANANFFNGRAGDGFVSISPVGPGGGAEAIVDDLYVTDGELLGDIKIQVLYPNADTSPNTWTAVGAGSSNFDRTKEHPADDDTTYVSGAAAGDKELYDLDDIGGFTGIIKGAQALWLVKKSDVGAASVKGYWKSGGTEVQQAANFNPSAFNYLYDIQAARKSLFTAADWTVAEINALKLGIERTV